MIIGLVAGVLAVLLIGALVTTMSGGTGGGLVGGIGKPTGEGEVGQKVAVKMPGLDSGEGHITVLGVEWTPATGKKKPVVTVGLEVTARKEKVANNAIYCILADGEKIARTVGPEPQYPDNFRVTEGKTVRGLISFEMDRPEECFLGFHLQGVYTKIRIPAQNAGQPARDVTAVDVPARRTGEPFEVTLQDGRSATVTVDKMAWRGKGSGMTRDEEMLVLDLTIVGGPGGGVPVTLAGTFVVYAGDNQARTRPVDANSPDLDRDLGPGQRITLQVQASVRRAAGRVESVANSRPQAQIPLPA